jgi:hypothetical protein
MSSFDNVWNELQNKLKPGIQIANWTAHHGYLGDEMTVVEITPLRITFEAPKAKNLQNVPKDDFEFVWQHWDGYIEGEILRQYIRDRTRYSKYIISTLKWLVEKSGN